MGFKNYIISTCKGVASLLTGLKTSITVFFRKKTTEQYPENRATLKISDRFRGVLYMPLKEDGSSKCVGCGICQNACPNGTITVITKSEVNPETARPKKCSTSTYTIWAAVHSASCASRPALTMR